MTVLQLRSAHIALAATKTEVVETAALPGKPPAPLTLDQLRRVAQVIRMIRLRERIENLHP